MIAIAAVAGVIVLVTLVCIVTYNRFVRQRQYIDNAWSNVDTELQRRHDLVPNLVETVKGYAAHERNVLEAVTTARARAIDDHGTPEQRAATENRLADTLRSLFAVSEAYPDLQASSNFLDLQHQLVTTEDRIQAARRFYNNNVRAYNERVQSVPANMIARLFGFEERAYFDVEASLRAGGTPEISLEPE